MVPLSCSKQVRAVTPRWNSSSSLGGPGSAQGGEDNQDRGRVSQKDPPRTCPAVQSSGSNSVLPLRGHGFSSGRLEPPLPRDPRVPGPSQGPSLPRLPPMFPTFLIPGVPRGVSPLNRQLAGCGRLPPLPLLRLLLLELLHVPLQVPEPGVLFVPAQPVHQGRAKATPRLPPTHLRAPHTWRAPSGHTVHTASSCSHSHCLRSSVCRSGSSFLEQEEKSQRSWCHELPSAAWHGGQPAHDCCTSCPVLPHLGPYHAPKAG